VEEAGLCWVEGAEVVGLREVVVVVVVVGLVGDGLVVEEESLAGFTLVVGRIAREVRPSALLVWEETVVGRKLGLGPEDFAAGVVGPAGVSLVASENFLAEDLEVAWAEVSLGVARDDSLVAVGFLVVVVAGFVDEEVTFLGVAVVVLTGFLAVDVGVFELVTAVFLAVEDGTA